MKYFSFEVFQCLKNDAKCLANKNKEDSMERSYKKIWGKKRRWHFSEQRWEWSDGCVALRFPSRELRQRLGIDDIALVLQQNRLWWHGHVLRKQDDDWLKKCMEYEVAGSRPRDRPKRTWREVVEEDCQAHKLNKEDAMDRSRWRKLIKDVWWSGRVWVDECFFLYQPTRVVLCTKGR